MACAGAGCALLVGCGEVERDPIPQFPTSVGGGGGSGGSALASGAGGAPIAGSGGSATSGAAGSSVVTGCQTDANPVPAPNPLMTDSITAQAKSDGCARSFPCQVGIKRTLTTMGTKAADCADKLVDGRHVCGPWSAARDFWVYLPANYDQTKPYPLIIEAPGCGGNGGGILGLDNVKDMVIRVGVSPGPHSTGHGIAPDQGCFDTHEGDDSIDWVFYERLYDKLNDEVCFDRRRVFVWGDSNGGTLANELGCKYAGDPVRPVRSVLGYNSSLPAEPQYAPTCSQGPLAGMWIHELRSVETPPEGFERAVSRAMGLAQCPGGDYDHALFQSFPIGGGNPDEVCQRIVGCDPLYPLVVCPLPALSQSSNPQIQNPGFATFVKMFTGSAPLQPPQ